MKKRLFGYIKEYKGAVIFAIVFAFFASLGTIYSTFLSGRAIDCIKGTGDVDFYALVKILAVLGIVYVITSVSTWLIARFANKASYFIVRDMRRDVFEKLNKLPLKYFDSTAHGDIISRYTNDLDNVSDAMVVSVTSLFSGVVTIVSALIFMFMLNIPLTITILVVTPLCVVVAAYLTRKCHKTFIKQQQAVGKLSAYIAEIVGNEKTVKAFCREDITHGQLSQISDELYEAASKAMFASAMVNPSTRFVNNVGYIAAGMIGGILAVKYDVSVGVVSSFLIYSSQFAKPINEISSITTQLQTAVASLERVFALLDEEEQIPDDANAKIAADAKGDIKFDNISFGYNPDKKIIKNLSYHAKAGTTTAIVGPTGCGKTTLVNMLMRFYDPQEGAIYLDGADIRNITRDSLRRCYAMVLQDSWIFNGTVKENIAYGKPDATDEQIIEASKAAYAHSFIKRMSNGYDTEITAESLSHGQRQLITIARAMLTDPEMLILDEATSSIDSLTEIRVQKAFLKLMENRTGFVIAHRLSTIVNSDCILVMKDGEIIERGTHDQLLEQKGFYYDLYTSRYEQVQ